MSIKNYDEEIERRGHPENFAENDAPICAFCGESMQNYIPDKGKFKGQLQKYCWFCSCHPNLVLSIG